MNRFGRYSSLARQLSASELAALAARRAYRAARKALYREQLFPDENRLLGSFGVTNRAELAEKALLWRSGRSWAETAQRPRVLAALAVRPEAQARAVARAETAVQRSFDVFGQRVTFGAGNEIAWTLDVQSGHRYPMIPAGEVALQENGSDPKFPWVLGRLDQLIALGQGYWASQNPADRARYVRELLEQTSSFLRHNPPGIGIHWTCSMEVALRACNLAQALLMFADAPEVNEPSFLVQVLGALAQHLRFIEAHLEDEGAVPNNHLVADYVGLFVVSALFPELPGASRYLARSASGLREQMHLQVHTDGFSFEGSVPYHRLAIELFTLAYITAVANGIDLGSEFDPRLEQMYRVAEAYCSRRGLAPQLGDNDSGRALPFCDRESLDHGYLSALGACLFGTPSLKRPGATLPDEALWLLGIRGLTRFEALEARAPDRLFSSPLGGLHVLKTRDILVAISAGANGQRGVGGHSHNDKLSFELHLGGVPVIVDPGSPTYTRDPSVRNRFRSTALHNTPQVDGREQAALSPCSLFALPDTAGAAVDHVSSSPELDILCARHQAFLPVEVQRTFKLDKVQRALVVSDVFRGQERHSVTTRLHLPDREVTLRDATPDELARVEAVAPAVSFAGRVVVLGLAQAPRALVFFNQGLSVSVEDAHFSPGYGQLRDASCVVGRWDGEVPASLAWVILFP